MQALLFHLQLSGSRSALQSYQYPHSRRRASLQQQHRYFRGLQSYQPLGWSLCQRPMQQSPERRQSCISRLCLQYLQQLIHSDQFHPVVSGQSLSIFQRLLTLQAVHSLILLKDMTPCRRAHTCRHMIKALQSGRALCRPFHKTMTQISVSCETP